VTSWSPLKLPQCREYGTWGSVSVGVTATARPSMSLCPSLALTSRKRHDTDTDTMGPLVLRSAQASETGSPADKTLADALGHLGTTELKCRVQRRTGWHLRGTVTSAVTPFINANWLLHDWRVGERCLRNANFPLLRDFSDKWMTGQILFWSYPIFITRFL
jgi:hypothetical protein